MGQAPGFLIRALRDADGANLDGVQIVKGCLDASGKTHERVHDVVWSGNRKRGAEGEVPAVANTVDVKDASGTNSVGAATREASWKAPGFDSKLRAFHCVRVLEIFSGAGSLQTMTTMKPVDSEWPSRIGGSASMLLATATAGWCCRPQQHCCRGGIASRALVLSAY
jgi:hypothetical protein